LIIVKSYLAVQHLVMLCTTPMCPCVQLRELTFAIHFGTSQPDIWRGLQVLDIETSLFSYGCFLHAV